MDSTKKFFFESLGCPKNRVDSEIMMATLINDGWEKCTSPNEADLVILNTCSFIEKAREESIHYFFKYHSCLKKGAKIGITGCLPQLYPDIKKLLKEADFVAGIDDIPAILSVIEKGSSTIKPSEFIYNSSMERALTLSPYTAYLKIADGCENYCSYCSIPFIRGKYRERDVADITKEIKNLVACGVKEIVLISQDTTKYGFLNGSSLSELLTEIESISGKFWVRVMYLYPDKVDTTLLKTIKNSTKTVNYFEIPFQHVSNKVLEKMNRTYRKSEIENLISQIKKLFGKNYTLRTTFISSFPSETKKEHEELKSFIKEGNFDYLGAFQYSKEKETKAGKMRSISKVEAEKRFSEIEKVSHIEMEKQLDRFVGMEMEVLYEGIDPDLNIPIGRGWHQAPEIDGITIITNISNEKAGTFCKCRIVGREGTDFIAEII
ncbi:MAG: 30S ribosomal protein S12 methylthiotransferase RimO [bacterium]